MAPPPPRALQLLRSGPGRCCSWQLWPHSRTTWVCRQALRPEGCLWGDLDWPQPSRRRRGTGGRLGDPSRAGLNPAVSIHLEKQKHRWVTPKSLCRGSPPPPQAQGGLPSSRPQVSVLWDTLLPLSMTMIPGVLTGESHSGQVPSHAIVRWADAIKEDFQGWPRECGHGWAPGGLLAPFPPSHCLWQLTSGSQECGYLGLQCYSDGAQIPCKSAVKECRSPQ